LVGKVVDGRDMLRKDRGSPMHSGAAGFVVLHSHVEVEIIQSSVPVRLSERAVLELASKAADGIVKTGEKLKRRDSARSIAEVLCPDSMMVGDVCASAHFVS
jgi:hypothetical protein